MSSPLQPVYIPVPTLTADAAALRVAWPIHAIVEASESGLFVQAGNVRIPLGTTPALVAGQVVVLELLNRPEGLRLQITPLESFIAQSLADSSTVVRGPAQSPTPPNLPQSPPQTPTVDAPPSIATAETARNESLQALVRAALESLATAGNRVSMPPEAATPLVPSPAPLDAAVVRSLMALFATRGALGEDLTVLLTMMNEAAAAGVAPIPPALEKLLLTEDVFRTSEQELRQTFATVLRRAATPAEARLALVPAEDAAEVLLEHLREDLPTQLAQLRQNPALSRFLEARGQLRAFHDVVGRVIDRIAAGHLQNLRALDHTYLFMELAFPADSPIRFGQVHMIGEEGGTGRRFDPRHATVVLDLSTTRLGDLWIRLTVAANQCSCTFLTTESEAVAAIAGESPSLVEALNAAGYPNARVHVALWDGDRFRETVALMRRFAGINVSA